MVHKELFVNNTESGVDFRFIEYFVLFHLINEQIWKFQASTSRDVDSWNSKKNAWRRKELLNDISWLSLFRNNSQFTWIHIMWCRCGKFVEKALIRKLSYIPWFHITWCENGHFVNIQFIHLSCVVSSSFIIYILFPLIHITWCGLQ